jgi:phosphate transport system substrate-binding protein
VFDVTTGQLVAGVVVPPIDINGNGQADANEYYRTKDDAVKAIADVIYPSPPARFENLATNGKPTGLTLAFIQWILTDGQNMLDEAGYVPLTTQQQEDALGKLK